MRGRNSPYFVFILIACLCRIVFQIAFSGVFEFGCNLLFVGFSNGNFRCHSGGRLINRIGRKPLFVVTSVIQGMFATLITFMPNAWASAAMWMVSASFASVAITC